MRESALDCSLFRENNMQHPDISAYNCFNFSDESQLKKELGFGYRNDISSDMLLETKGLNSPNAELKTIDVIEIEGLISKNKIVKLYLDQKTHYVYDRTTNNIMGKIDFDDFDFPIMHKKNIYVITSVPYIYAT